MKKTSALSITSEVVQRFAELVYEQSDGKYKPKRITVFNAVYAGISSGKSKAEIVKTILYGKTMKVKHNKAKVEREKEKLVDTDYELSARIAEEFTYQTDFNMNSILVKQLENY